MHQILDKHTRYCLVLQAKDSQIDEEVKSEKSLDENDSQFRCTLCNDKFKHLSDVEKHTYSYHQIADKHTRYCLVLQSKDSQIDEEIKSERSVDEIQELSERLTVNVIHCERVRIGFVSPWSTKECLEPWTGQHKDKLVGSDSCLIRKHDSNIRKGISDERRLLVEAEEKLRDTLGCPPPVGAHCL